jgi:hypothetical protein
LIPSLEKNKKPADFAVSAGLLDKCCFLSRRPPLTRHRYGDDGGDDVTTKSFETQNKGLQC